MRNATRAYSAVANKTASPRELEADLLLTAAARLQAIRDRWSDKNTELNAALLFNRKLWSIFVTSATSAESPLPAGLRQNVANLGIFVFKQTLAVQADPKPENLGSLININRELAAGLLARA
ncbi:MAG TPA: flagellar biosynthesis regulator FlaF [Pseudolabrys sp.]